MHAENFSRLALYVDRATQQWIVRDPEGNFWSLPSTTNPWERRQPFVLDAQVELQQVPAHYKYLLCLPF